MLRTYLPSVIAHTKGAEIIVADNGSTDDSLEVLHKEFPSVKTIVLDTNASYAFDSEDAFAHGGNGTALSMPAQQADF